MSRTKLLRCPFCGAKAQIEKFTYYDAPAYCIGCTNGAPAPVSEGRGSTDNSCIGYELFNGKIYGSRLDAAEAWNKRTLEAKV